MFNQVEGVSIKMSDVCVEHWTVSNQCSITPAVISSMRFATLATLIGVRVNTRISCIPMMPRQQSISVTIRTISCWSLVSIAVLHKMVYWAPLI